jgi:hypothetical protein
MKQRHAEDEERIRKFELEQRLIREADERRRQEEAEERKRQHIADQVRHHKEEHQRMEDEKKAFEVEVTI